MVQSTSSFTSGGNVSQLQYDVARDVAVLKKQQEVVQQEGESALKLIRSSGIGQLLDIRV